MRLHFALLLTVAVLAPAPVRAGTAEASFTVSVTLATTEHASEQLCPLGRLNGIQRGALSPTKMYVTAVGGAVREVSRAERAKLECRGANLAAVLSGASTPAAELLIEY
ncbi:hypothetical protein GCM10028813_00060 [Ramlibacter alkalitolerans]